MYKIKVQENEYEATQDGGQLSINGETLDWDLAQLSEGRFHALYKNQSFDLEVEQADYATKTFKIKVNGQSLTLTAQDSLDLLLNKLGMSDALTQAVKDVPAPMPGLILDILVKEGDEVQKGDKLLILEAMKMENVVKSPGDGTVTAISVTKGQNVDKGDVLIKF